MLKESKSIENFSLKSHHSKYSEIGASIEQGSNVYNSRAKNSYRSRLIDISPLTTTNENELIGKIFKFKIWQKFICLNKIWTIKF